MSGRSARTLGLRLAVGGLLAVAAVLLLSRAPAPEPPPPPGAVDEEPDFGPLVDVAAIDPAIVVELRYAGPDNILGRPFYPVNRALLLPVAAERLVRVQDRLREQGYGLKVWDAYRPPAAQRDLWEAFPDPRYVTPPDKGSNHSRGAAVDVTLVDLEGNEVEMPSDYDDFTLGWRDHPRHSPSARLHMEILTGAMVAEGFVPYAGEWWHFSEPGADRYPLLEVSLEGN